MKELITRILKIAGTALVVLLVMFVIWFISGEGEPAEDITWGVSFFPKQARDLELNWRGVYLALLDDMGARHLRLAAPWNEHEPQKGEYDFSDLDWMLTEAQSREAEVIMNVGRKLFRWPECHDPEWLQDVTQDELDALVLGYLEESVNHLKQYDNIVAWQVENEVIFPFGECYGYAPTKELFEKEVALVRSLDERPIVSTDSGELSSWNSITPYVDSLGVSLYRVTENPLWGRFYYPLRPGFYQKKAAFIQSLHPGVDEVYISELQLEPWTLEPLLETTLRDQYDSMSYERMESSVYFAGKTGFPDIYVWGVEWWYWLKQEHRDVRYWNLAREIMHGRYPVW